MGRDQREAGLTSITPKCKGQRPLEIQRCDEAKTEQRATCLENSMDPTDVSVGSMKSASKYRKTYLVADCFSFFETGFFSSHFPSTFQFISIKISSLCP